MQSSSNERKQELQEDLDPQGTLGITRSLEDDILKLNGILKNQSHQASLQPHHRR